MRKVRNLRSKKGFSLAEVLIVVAIIGILLAVAIPNVLAYYRALKLTELDDSARTIFLAAQNRITALKNQGVDLETLGKKSDHVIRTRGAGGAGVNYYFIGTDNIGVDTGSSDGKLRTILPGGSIDTQLQGNHYVVEFDPTTGAVYAVWYWENGKFNYNTDAYKVNRVEKPGENKDSRLPYMVGYYGGTTIERAEVNQMPIPQVNIINAEELKVDITIPSLNDTNAHDQNVRVSVLVDGKPIVENAPLWTMTKANVVLDTLKTGTYAMKPDGSLANTGWTVGAKFKNWVSDKSLNSLPGDDITVTVVASYEGALDNGNYLIPQSVSATVNSLFESIEQDPIDTDTYIANIAYGRHLQNLHDSADYSASPEFCSGVVDNEKIKKAKLTKNIDFNVEAATAEENIFFWKSTYPGTNDFNHAMEFHPISNKNITEFNGGGLEIRNMCAGREGFGGLFSYVSNGIRLLKINLVNAQIHSESITGSAMTGASAGGLIAQSAGGTVYISNCNVYSDCSFDGLELDTLETEGAGKNNDVLLGAYPHIGAPETGSNVGGLIGSVTGGSVQIVNSHASTILVGAGFTGGLVGNNGQSAVVTISNSYAANFIYSNKYTGGLVGFAKEPDTVVIDNSYATGVIKKGYEMFTAAGLAFSSDPESVKATNSYAAIKYICDSGDTVNGTPNLAGSDIAGTIFGTYYGDDTGTNYYVKQNGITYGSVNNSGAVSTVDCGEDVTSKQLADMVGSFGVAGSAWYAPATGSGNPTGVTYPYRLIRELKDVNSLTIPYPYPMLTDEYGNPVPHYGDWLENKANGSLVNWEAYPTTAGGTEYGVWGYIGTDSGVQFIGDNTLLKGKAGDTVLDYAVADGYGVLVKRESGAATAAPNVMINGTDITSTLTTKIENAYTDGSDSYDLYTIPAPDHTAEPTGYYTEVDVNGSVFLYNPDFACEVFLKDEHPDAPAAPLAKEKVGSTDGSNAINADANNVIIRTARQLANMAYYTNLTGSLGNAAKAWSYNQLLDIDYGKYTGAELDGNGGIDGAGEYTRQKPATLVGDGYSGTTGYDGNNYVIRHLYIGSYTDSGAAYAGLFGKINYASISNVQLVNVNVSAVDVNYVGGLAGYVENNSSTSIDNCGIYVEDEENDGVDDEYTGYCITSDGNSTSSNNFTGGLIGHIHGGTVTSCFASVKVSGVNNTGGFAGLISSVAITDCYSGGHTSGGQYEFDSVNVTGKQNVGGFVGNIVGPNYNGTCYSTCSVYNNGTTTQVVGLFSGLEVSDLRSVTNVVAYATGTAFAPAGMTPKLVPEPYLLTGNAIPRDDTGTVSAVPYDSTLGDDYPFASGQTVHHGDWVEAETPAMAYIEKYDDGGYGIYAAVVGTDGNTVSRNINTLQSGDTVTVVDDFYRVICKKSISSLEAYLDDSTTAVDLEPDTTEFDPDGKTDDGYYVYNFDGSDDDAATATNYYHKLTFSGNTFYFNPNFACEAFDVTAAAASLPDQTNKLKKPGAAGKDDTTTTYAEAGVIIRSARQLANIQKYTNYTADTAIANAAKGWTYEQLLDVDFDAYESTTLIGKDQGTGTIVRLDPATLTSGTYNGHGKKIQNLYIGAATEGAGLFARVGESGETYGTVTGVMLENVDVKGGADAPSVGGLVGTLYGKVENSGIYVFKAENYTGATGFTVTGGGDNGVGGLIGYIFGGAVTDSFAAVKVEGTDTAAVAPTAPTNPVGGFVGHIHGGSITNCYAGGFVDKDSKNYKSGSVNVKGFNNVGGFVGSVSATATFAGVNYSTASVGDGSSNGLFAGSAGSNDAFISGPTGSGKLYAVAVAFDTATNKVVAARDESAYLSDPDMPSTVTVTTVPYNQTDDFPYESRQTTHHGDWIVVKVMGLYYDTVDSTTGYYANGNKVTGVAELQTGEPGDGAVASDDGYMFVSTADIGDIAITVGGKSYPMSAEELASDMIVGGATYTHKYEVPADALNAPTENYYTVVSLDGRLFTANFGFAGEIYEDEIPKDELNTVKAKSGLKYNEKKTLADGSYAVIRTARQLANLGIRSNEGTYTDNEKKYTDAAKAIQGAKYVQLLDIDYSQYTSEIPDPAVLEGSNEHANHTPITLNGNGYDGNEYVIRNLIPGMIRQVTIVDTDGSVTEAQVQSGLFGRVTKGEISNVMLVNATVDNDASKVVSSGAAPTVSEKMITSKGNSAYGGTGNSVVLNFANFDLVDEGTRADGEYLNEVKSGAGTENDGCFALLWTSNSKIAKDKSWSTSYNQYMKFSGKASTTSNSIRFTTSGPATVSIWWIQDNNTERQMVILDSLGNEVARTNQAGKGSAFNDDLSISEAGTYYLGGSNGGNLIFRVAVKVSADTVPVPASLLPHSSRLIMPIASGGDDGFPADVGSDKYKIRFGALVGAVNPADTTPDSVTINNCGAYVDKDPTDTDYETAYTKYVVKNNGANDTTGGLIGMATKGATIKSSFAAVKVTGVEYVGGFAGHLKNVTVVDCYSGGHTVKGIYSKDNFNVTATSGFAGGFAGRLEQGAGDSLTFEGVSYSTCSAKGSTAGQFAGNTTESWEGWESATTLYGIGSAEGTEAKEDYLNNFYVVAKSVTTTLNAYPYDTAILDGKGYPYTTGTSQKEHHGDWTVRVNFIYYEVYEGSTDTGDDVPVALGANANLFTEYTGTDLKVGFYGVLNNGTPDGETINSLSTTGYVVDSGYMILSEDDQLTTLEFSINSRYKGADHEKTYTFKESERIELSKILADKAFRKYGFIIPHDLVKLAPADTYYMPVTVNNQMYMLNPHFACEVVNIGFLAKDSDENEINKPDYDTVRTKTGMKYRDIVYGNDGKIKSNTLVTDEKINGIIIRSPFNFASMARYTRTGNTSVYRDKSRQQNYFMLMDVDYTRYIGNVIYDGYDTNRVDTGITEKVSGKDETVYNYMSGTNYAYGQVPATLVNGSFNAYGHTLSNLYLANDSSYNFYVGIFSGLDHATVQNLRVKNLHMTTDTPAEKDKDSGHEFTSNEQLTFIGGIAAQVFNGSKVQNVGLEDVEIDIHRTPGYDKDNTKFKYNDSFSPVRAVGGAVGAVIDGTVKNVTVDGIKIDLTGKEHYYSLPTGGQKKIEVLTTGTTDEKSSPIVDDTKEVCVGGAIGEIDTNREPMAEEDNGTGNVIGKVDISNVYVTDALISANRGTGNMVGGLIGRADGKAEGDPAVAGTHNITVSNSGVSLRDMADMGDPDKDPFNTKYGVLDNGSKKGEAVGGFIGRSDNYVSISNCFSAIRVQGQGNVGGFAGDIEGSYIESCFSGGHTMNGSYDDSATAVANVTGVEANTAGGFAGKIEASDTLTFKGTIYTTSSVTNTGSKPVGRFQAGDSNVNAVANAKRDGENVVLYAAGKIVGTGVKQIDEKGYLLTGALIPSNTNASFETKPYDPDLKDGYPYASTTKINTRGDDANPVPAHYGDWAEYAADGAFYWELEDGVYHFYTVTDDGSEVETDPGLCEERDGNSITKWGYGVFSHVDGDTSINIGTLTEDMDPDADAAKAELLKKYSTARNVVMIQGAKAKSGPVEVKITGNTFRINPAYAAAVEAVTGTSGTSTMGKEGNPYQIRTAQQLDNIGDSTGTYFKQTHDISGKDYTGTFTPNSLTNGEYNGRSYRILDLKIDAAGGDAALFSALANSDIKNTILYSTTFGADACTITGNRAAGIAASMNGGSITDSIVAGYTVSGQTIGGLVAETQGDAAISNSQATVTRSITEAGGSIGGLVGYVSSGTLNLTESYAGGDVETAGDLSSATGKMSIGGIVGARHASSSATDTTKYVKYDTVYSYVAMAEDDIKFNTTKKKDSEGNNTSDYEYVTFYGIGPDVDTTKTDTIGYWSGGVLDPNTEDRNLGTALANLKKWHTGHEAEQVYMPNPKSHPEVTDSGATALTDIVKDYPFIYGEYVKDVDGKPIHYGDWPVASLYAGLFNWEKEQVKFIDETTNTEQTRTEYHFYAYGVELVRGKLFESILLDNLCKDHHVNERATILESGYGYFLPDDTASGGIDFNFAVMKGTAENVTNKFTFADEDDATHMDDIAAIKNELFSGNNLHEVAGDDYNIHLLFDSENTKTEMDHVTNVITKIGIEKFADVRDLNWQITAKEGSKSETFGMLVFPTFGEAIYSDDFDMGEGDKDKGDVNSHEPLKVRTRLQFERLKSNAENRSIDKIALDHDIDFAEREADGYAAGVASCDFLDQSKSNYVPGQVRTKLFDGQGYRLIDVMISVNNTVASTNYTDDDLKYFGAGNHHLVEEIKDYNNPDGDAALFLNGRDSTETVFKNLVLYSPGNTGVIETSVTGDEMGYAAGIIARANTGYGYVNDDDEYKSDGRNNKFAFENCVVAGYTIKGYGAVGGIVGVATNDNTNTKKENGVVVSVAHPIPMMNCQVVADLVGRGAKTYIGGLAGNWRGNIDNCYSGGAITLESGVTATSNTRIGGIVGESKKSDDAITNCYTFMDFTGLKDATNAKIYPIAGNATIGNTNSYFSDYVDGVTLTIDKDNDKSESVTLAEMIKAREDEDVADYSYWLSNEPDCHGYVANEMGTFPFKAVVTLDGVGKVHYGKWPEGIQGAGVAYYEKYGDNTYGFQIVGIKPDGASLAFDNLCKDRHTDLNSNDQIVETGYLAFTTRAGKVTVGTDNTLSGIGSALGSTKAEEVKMELANALASNIEGISVYPTFKVTDLSSGNYTDYVLTPSVEVTAGTNKATVYYTNGFAGVSDKDTFGRNSGTPIQIRTVLQLDNIQYFDQNDNSKPKNNDETNNTGKFFKQTHDLYGESYSVYTGAVRFDGTYDGGSYRILELSMSSDAGVNNVGLFSGAGGMIKNVIMYSPSGEATIRNNNRGADSSSNNGGYRGAGGIAGQSVSEDLSISNCVVAGYTITGCDMVGGIVGYSYCGGTIEGCAAVNDLVGNTGSSFARGMGGITGAGDHSGNDYVLKIKNCYAGGKITGADSGTKVGGIVGYDATITASSTVVQDSYSYVDIHNTGSNNVYTIGDNLDDSQSTGDYYLSDSLHVPSTCTTHGTAYDYFEMCERVNTAVKALETYVPDNSGDTGLTPNIQKYPFVAVVKDENDQLVHYGAMPTHEPIAQAITGIFYWDLHGSEYEVQYIGVNEAGADVSKDGLCDGRDGVDITESGFGYFYLGSGVTTTIDNEGDEVDSTALRNITNALKNNGVFNKVTVKAYERKTSATDTVWTVNGQSAAFDQRFAKVYKSGEAPKASGNAYAIRTAEQLSNIDSLNPGKEVTNYKFVQSHDVVFNPTSSSAYTPAYLSTGSEYDGQGYRILELSVSKADSSGYIGLFSRVKGTVKNVVLYSPSGEATISTSGGKYAGGIAGALSGSGTIDNCVVAGYTITGTVNSGGIAGYMNGGNNNVTNCQAVNVLDGGKNATGIGGIVGGTNSDSGNKVTNCYAGGKVQNANTGSGSKLSTNVGGIYGGNRSDKITVSTSYSYVDLNSVGASNFDGRLCSIGYGYSGSGCYYLEGTLPTGGTAQGNKLESTTSITGFGKVANAYAPKEPSVSGGVAGDGTVTPLTDKTFPYPAIFKVTVGSAATYEHYGTWVDATGSGDPGIPEGPSFEAAILPEKLILPDAEDKENKGGDGHTEYVSMRSFIARVHMLRS